MLSQRRARDAVRVRRRAVGDEKAARSWWLRIRHLFGSHESSSGGDSQEASARGQALQRIRSLGADGPEGARLGSGEVAQQRGLRVEADRELEGALAAAKPK